MKKTTLILAVLMLFASVTCWAGSSDYEVNKSNSTVSGSSSGIKSDTQKKKEDKSLKDKAKEQIKKRTTPRPITPGAVTGVRG